VAHITLGVKVSRTQEEQSRALVARPSAPAGVVRRARVVLLSAAGISGVEIAAQLDLSAERSRGFGAVL